MSRTAWHLNYVSPQVPTRFRRSVPLWRRGGGAQEPQEGRGDPPQPGTLQDGPGSGREDFRPAGSASGGGGAHFNPAAPTPLRARLRQHKAESELPEASLHLFRGCGVKAPRSRLLAPWQNRPSLLGLAGWAAPMPVGCYPPRPRRLPPTQLPTWDARS